MSDQPPLRKPRHADGRLMTEDEIQALDGRELDVMVHACIINNDPTWERHHLSRVRCYSDDIAAAFEVDRPEWRWVMDEFKCNCIAVMAWFYPATLPHNSETVKCGEYEQELDHKPTPADYARARCIAALLLAAQIGE